jgi:hypothetical protein
VACTYASAGITTLLLRSIGDPVSVDADEPLLLDAKLGQFRDLVELNMPTDEYGHQESLTAKEGGSALCRKALASLQKVNDGFAGKGASLSSISSSSSLGSLYSKMFDDERKMVGFCWLNFRTMIEANRVIKELGRTAFREGTPNRDLGRRLL